MKMQTPSGGSIINEDLKIEIDAQRGIVNELSQYNPNETEKAIRQMVITHFTLGNVTQFTPRVEFNDLSLIYRDQVDQMSFNTYQPNDGNASEGDEINGWHSNAIRPVVRNKCVSVGAHSTARMIFPKIFAFDRNSESQQDAAQVMMDLMEWSAEQSNYTYTSLIGTLQAEISPASIIHTEYTEMYREVKREKDGKGKWKKETILDETLSGFQDTVVPVDQLYIENFYEPDIQKQQWLIWRRVQNYSLLESKYKNKYENFKYVKPGVQVLYNDANQSFYNVYDPNMRQYMGEEVIYWNRSMDLMLILVNGVLLTPADNPNPRNDKLFPFAKYGYEMINPKCFYYKSLAFKVSRDANIINTLYPIFVDGSYLNLMPPMLQIGGEAIASDVIVPGSVTTLSDPGASLSALKVATDLKSGMEALSKVEESLNQTSDIPTVQGTGQQTAYEISKREQERNTILGMFLTMIGSYVKQFGKLRLGDILQYMTVADVDKITDDPELVYKTFLLHDKKSGGKRMTRKIKFDKTLSSDPMSEDQKLNESYKTLEMQGGKNDIELYRVNPELVRDLKYMVVVSPDVLNPLSEEVERAFMLEEYDRAIQNPLANQETVFKDFLLSAYPKSARDPEKYVNKPQPGANPMDQIGAMMQGGGGQPQQNNSLAMAGAMGGTAPAQPIAPPLKR